MREYNKEKYTCSVCGGSYSKNNTWMHLRTKKHQYAVMIAEKNNTPIEKIAKRTQEKIDIETCDVCFGTYLPGKYDVHCKTLGHIRAENYKNLILRFSGKYPGEDAAMQKETEASRSYR